MFNTEIKVRFNHVDAAGLVFYPRYYEMLNEVIEKWFEQHLGYDFRALRQQFGVGVPAVAINATFPKPTELGETLLFGLQLKQLGQSSINVEVRASCDSQDRLIADATLVCVAFPQGGEIVKSPIPPELKTALARDAN